ncbi:MAG: TIGR03084 family protein [Hyphomonas sp.]|uniref:TIGR03084 family metal-binding protein n=1 Tax=Hyphomonas sp. TaxID=87 RepID=UPI0017C0C4A2|nr:TIGR03084 family metal-binding protein [Hyphomonas sp.]MBA3069734.1 TIGR03084 family protein [Hyphomonas sp.]MBU3921959.1 TIGR03084 family protein [Alphaproteobacteria bacterium]MBU4062575.1 TIGR03084 family protein [Alphaproteobacteria bacterium]MBU4163926.1 TIGR03084 family protein [Alphaproteobacteria bacterium]
MQQAEDFRQETRALSGLVATLHHSQYYLPTQFRDWTVMDVLRHLHFWNGMAHFQISDPDTLAAHLKAIQASGAGMRAYEAKQLGHLGERALLEEWSDFAEEAADIFAEADPKARLKWAGPDMSARSSITARQMETWAHGQEIFDFASVERRNEDRISNIVTLGVNTFGWTYATRRQTPPGPMPHLALTAPSGASWTYGEASQAERIEGRAEEFCQVVTQTRNIADTALKVTGPVAADWMSKAQCFAGAPAEPPAPGTRHVLRRAIS